MIDIITEKQDLGGKIRCEIRFRKREVRIKERSTRKQTKRVLIN